MKPAIVSTPTAVINLKIPSAAVNRCWKLWMINQENAINLLSLFLF